MSFKVRMTLQLRYNETKNDKQTGDKFEIVACQSYSVPVAAADKHQGAVNNRTYKNPECLQSDFIRAQNKLAEHKRSKPAHNNACSASHICKAVVHGCVGAGKRGKSVAETDTERTQYLRIHALRHDHLLVCTECAHCKTKIGMKEQIEQPLKHKHEQHEKYKYSPFRRNCRERLLHP